MSSRRRRTPSRRSCGTIRAYLGVPSSREARHPALRVHLTMTWVVYFSIFERPDAPRRNVLVATCIAEEGLDIGAVDVCVFYDQVGSPISMVQRMGRTARRDW